MNKKLIKIRDNHSKSEECYWKKKKDPKCEIGEKKGWEFLLY